MLKRLNVASFGYGLTTATLLACVIGAAAKDPRGDVRYDAESFMGGLGLQIVDHKSDVLYRYQRVKKDDRVTYDLYETIDLSAAGKAQIPAKTVEK